MFNFAFHRPTSLEEAQRLKAEIPGARLIAGGTDVLVKLKKGVPCPSDLISVRNLRELKQISGGEVITIGASVTVSELLASPLVQQELPILLEACTRLACVQIRNVATLGGNLCNASPCADLAPPLLVLEANMRILGTAGERRVPLRSFMVAARENCLAPDELLVAVEVSRPRAGSCGVFLKQARVGMDLALASLAVMLEPDGDTRAWRIAAGSVAPTPIRLARTETLLSTAPDTSAALPTAQALADEEVRPISDVRASATYRRQLIRVFLGRAVAALQTGRSA